MSRVVTHGNGQVPICRDLAFFYSDSTSDQQRGNLNAFVSKRRRVY